MRYLFSIGLIYLISQLLFVRCGLLPPKTHKVKFSIPRKSNDQSISYVYVSLDSSAYRDISAVGINSNGIRATYVLFFQDGSYKGPISFDQTLYKLSTFYNEEKEKELYGPKANWGRYSVNKTSILFEVGVCEYTPSCRFRLKTGTFDIINDSTLKFDPQKQENTYFYRKSVITFHKIDSIDLSFIDPSKAWPNKRDLKRKNN
jgi:hypothetical protein